MTTVTSSSTFRANNFNIADTIESTLTGDAGLKIIDTTTDVTIGTNDETTIVVNNSSGGNINVDLPDLTGVLSKRVYTIITGAASPNNIVVRNEAAATLGTTAAVGDYVQAIWTGTAYITLGANVG